MRNAFCWNQRLPTNREFSDAMRISIPSLPSLLLVISLALALSPVASAAEDKSDANTEAVAEQATPEADKETQQEQPKEQETPITPLRVQPFPDAERHQGLIDYLKLHQRQQEVMTLVAGETSFYGLFLRERSGDPQGGVLILHDLEQHGHWPTLVAPLREGLTEHGWTTLALELPSAPAQTLPPRSIEPEPQAITDIPDSEQNTNTDITLEADDTGTKDDTSDQTLDTGITNKGITITAKQKVKADAEPDTTMAGNADDENSANIASPSFANNLGQTAQPEADNNYNQEIQARIAAGLSFLNERGQLNIAIIAIGDSAIWAAQLIQSRQRENDNARGIALLMINPREHPNSALRLTQVIETLDIPILDIITGDNRSPEWEQQDRKGAMKRKHLNGYQQIVQHSSSIEDPSVNRRIRGWLKTHAAGTEVP